MADSSGAAPILKKLTHRNLINLVRSFFPEMSEAGVCCGFSSMLAQARVTGKKQENEFYHRLDGISEYLDIPGNTVQSLKEEIMAGYAARKEALKAGHELPLSNLESLEIHAFCQMVALHQDQIKSSGILGRTINQSDKKSQYPLTASQALIDANKEIKYDTAGVLALNQQELVEYLESVQKILEEAKEKGHLKPDEEIAFLLGSDNHAVELTFDFQKKIWHFVDINKLNGKKEYYFEVSSAELAPIIFSSLEDKGINNTVFSIELLSTTNDERLLRAIKSLSNNALKKSMKKENSRGFDNLLLSVVKGDLESVKILLDFKDGFIASILRGIGLSSLDKSALRFKEALMKASVYGHTEIIKVLFACGAELDKSFPSFQNELMFASKYGHIETVKFLIKLGSDVTKKNQDRVNILMMAAQNGHTEIVKILLEAGADLKERDNDGLNAMMHASKNGHTETVRFLIKSSPRLSVNEKDNDGLNAMMHASKNGHTETVQLLIKSRTNPNKKDKNGLTAMMHASKNGHAKIVQSLIKARASINNIDKLGYTSLMYASMNGHVEVVKQLLAAKEQPGRNGMGVKVNEIDRSGRSALMLAIDRGHANVVSALLSAGANVVNEIDPTGRSALMLASENGDANLVRALLSREANVNEIEPTSGQSALMIAIGYGHTEIVQILLAAGANVKDRDRNNHSALMLASENGNDEIIKILLGLGLGHDAANLNEKGKYGWSVWMLASLHGNEEIIKMLVTAGANVNETDPDGWNALSYAKKYGHTEIVEILKAAGALELAAPLPVIFGATSAVSVSPAAHQEEDLGVDQSKLKPG